MLSQQEIETARKISWQLRLEAMHILRGTATWEAAQGVLPSSRLQLRERLPFALAEMRSHVRLCAVREAILGLYRITDNPTYGTKAVVSLRRLSPIITKCDGKTPHELAQKFWSVGISQADAQPSEIPPAIKAFWDNMRSLNRTKGTPSLREEIVSIRNNILAHSNLDYQNKFLVCKRRRATILASKLVNCTILIFTVTIGIPRSISEER
jgi:hypothetical protein